LPEVGTAYWLKEEFSDILQLWDRQKAEELTDIWLGRVEEFIYQLRSKYQEKKGRKFDCPFTNVLTTIKTWRPQILNYIDSKHINSSAVSNYFAEHVNKKLKKAKSLGNGIAFETVRMKAIHGGVMVRRRPRHPLSESQMRPKRRRQKSLNVNPDSNLELLKRAREDMDETKGLLAKPQESAAWMNRFRSTVRPSPESHSGHAKAPKNEDNFRAPRPAALRARGGPELHSPNPGRGLPEQALKPGDATPAVTRPTGKTRRERPKPASNQLMMFLEIDGIQ
jgi:Transposase